MQSSRPIKQGQLVDFISNSTQTALNLKANILNPSFSGTVKLLSNVPNGILTINGVNSIISLSGTTNLLTKWNASGTLSNSTITDTGAAITLGVATTVSGNLTATNLIRSGGAASQYLMADGSVTTSANIISGTINNIPKFTTANVVGNSRLVDTGTYLGISTQYTPIYDITFGRQNNRVISVETSDNTSNGRDLEISSGSANNSGDTTYLQTNQTSRTWTSISVHPNGNIYACTNGGDIYMQSGGTGTFNPLGQSSRAWSGIACHPNGNVYAVAGGGNVNSADNIYLQSGGTGTFVSLGQTIRGWSGIAVHPNGNVYATVGGVFPVGDIYLQSGGTGNFIGLGQTGRKWMGLVCHPNGNVYAGAYGDFNIYMQTGGTGNFGILTSTSFNATTLGVDTENNVIAAGGGNGWSSDIYIQSGGTGSFIVSNQVVRQWSSFVGYFPNGKIYTTVYGGDIYTRNANLGLPNLSGGTLKLEAGIGKGSGASNVEIYTGQITSSGTTMQVLTKRIIVDNQGNTTFNGLIIKSGGTSSQFLMADGSVTTGTTTLIIGNTITGTSYTLTNSDHSKQLQTTNTSAVTIIIPTGLTSGFACEIIQEGLGQVTISGASGTTLKYSSFEFPTTFEQYSVIGIESITNLTDNYRLLGQLSAI